MIPIVATALLLMALLVVSGCSITLASPELVAKHTQVLTDVENRKDLLRKGVRFTLNMMSVEHDVEEFIVILNDLDAVYWIFIYAAHTYLANGEVNLYYEALDNADAQIDVMEKAFKEWLESKSDSATHPMQNQIPDFRGWQEKKQDISL